MDNGLNNSVEYHLIYQLCFGREFWIQKQCENSSELLYPRRRNSIHYYCHKRVHNTSQSMKSEITNF